MSELGKYRVLAVLVSCMLLASACGSTATVMRVGPLTMVSAAGERMCSAAEDEEAARGTERENPNRPKAGR